MEAFEEAKSYAIQSIRYLKKDREVIAVDEETDRDGVGWEDCEQDLQPSSSSVVFNSTNGNLEVGNTEAKSEAEQIEIRNQIDEKRREHFNYGARPRDRRKRRNFITATVLGRLNLWKMKVRRHVELFVIRRNWIGRLWNEIFNCLRRWWFPIRRMGIWKEAESEAEKLEIRNRIDEKCRKTLQLLRSAKRPEEEDGTLTVLRESFLPFTEEEEAEVSRAFSNLNRRKALVTHKNFNIEFAREFLQCLRLGKWLNDESG
ncbi:cysteine proteinases superfamily protein [Actinidia rufa]|uniref:Cysteine proteinases superfamily protein n=1 Tax=Actinidia rufa TaxID=165716 RepID=A0A7J0E406_9ERIC|nr:cysteine proteinases superfamily protein [Actinidia rufa]